MKLTRQQLKSLIESYLYEEESEPMFEEEPEEEAEESDPMEEETPEEEAEESDPMEEETPEDDADSAEGEEDATEDTDKPDPEPGVDLPEKFNSFEIIVDDIKHKIQFIKDKSAGVLKALIDDKPIKNPKPQDFVALAGIGLQGVKDEELRGHLAKVVKADTSYEKFETNSEVAQQVKRKMDGSRPGYTNDYLRGMGLGKGSIS
tara:strand:- start:599 stop:1210 length:612 start_codon:yes stop_codon:yes gene_type:complete